MVRKALREIQQLDLLVERKVLREAQLPRQVDLFVGRKVLRENPRPMRR